MRPLELMMRAFGPYAKEEIVNFQELREYSLFLVTGPTGAGKTTIFDALCFALYGRTSGSDRENANVRSDFAPSSILTEVQLKFESGGKVYHIRRVPQQLKRKERGEGLTEQDAEATLQEVSSGDLLISGVKRVNNKIEEILGLDYDQFRQIVMIPQGEFRRLLTENSKDREEILRKIFNTESFRKVQEKLALQEKELQNQREQLLTSLRATIQQIDCSGNEDLANLIEMKLIHWPEFFQQVIRFIQSDQEQEQVIQQKLQAQEQILLQNRQVLFEAQEANKKRQQFEIIQKKVELFNQQRENKEKDLEKLQLGKKAQQIRLFADSLVRIEEKIQQKESEEKSLRQKGQILAQNLIEAERKLTQAKNSSIEQKQLLEQEIQIKAQLAKITELEAKEIEIKKHQNLFQLNETEQNRLEEQLGKAKNNLSLFEKKLTEMMEAEIKLTGLKHEVDQVKLVIAEFENWRVAYQELQDLRKKYKHLQQKSDISKRHFDLVKKHYEQVFEQFILGQASWLAGQLKENEPCPVCGSKNHPKPADLAQYFPSDHEVKQLADTLQKAQDVLQEIMEQKASVESTGHEKKKLLTQIIQRINGYLGENTLLKDHHEEQIILKMKEMQQKLGFLQSEATNLEAQILQKSSLQRKILESRPHIEQLEEKLKEVAHEKLIIHGQLESLQQWIFSFRQELPNHGQNKAELEEMLNKTIERRNLLERLLKESEVIYQNLILEQGSHEAVLLACQKELKGRQDERNIAIDHWHKALSESGFDNESSYQASLQDPELLIKLERNLNEFFSTLQKLEQEMALLQQELNCFSNIDITIAQQQVAQAEQITQNLMTSKTQIYARRSRNEDLLLRSKEIYRQLENIDENYRLIGHLALVANGKNNENVSFERYVLAAFFDDVVEAANLRLSKMTGNRYELNRMSEKSKARGQSGLELEVYDQYTGRFRPVKTLSGGESFKASLSLALGLADVVQSYAGGVRLETMFVDEGFGTLDPESLDGAIECLLDLQQAGRLVGIISHVPELKERIPARLEIESGPKGSSTHFVVP